MDASLIEDMVKWRMGSAYDAPILDWRDPQLVYDSAGALDIDIAGGMVVDHDGLRLSAPAGRGDYDPLKYKRLVDATKDIAAARADQSRPLSLFLAMQDARLFPSMEYMGPATAARCVQLCYARTVESYWRAETEVMLWPLTNYVKWWKLPAAAPAPWDGRRAELLWRGQPTGMSYERTAEPRPVLTGIRKVRRWLNGWLKDEVAGNAEEFHRWAASYQRLAAVMLCRGMPGTDVRMVPMYDGDRRSLEVVEAFLGSEAVAERSTGDEFLALQQQCKYALSLPGNDYPSSLRQDLLSGCLVLMPKPFWEGVWFHGLEAGVHYVALRADLADLAETLQWCRDNDAQCRDIAANARAFALTRFDPALEPRVQARMVERLLDKM